jgi:hypothetical protein
LVSKRVFVVRHELADNDLGSGGNREHHEGKDKKEKSFH